MEHNGQRIITPKVMSQLAALRIHIQNGCLSNVEPSGGTNYNEALHRRINPHFTHAGRMGLPLAYVLLTILLYTYNCNKECYEDSFAQKIKKQWNAKGKESRAQFGIIGSRYKNCRLGRTYEECNEEELTTDEGLALISVIDIEKIRKNAVASADLAHNMQCIVHSSPLFSYHMLPFMSGVPTLYFHRLCTTRSSDAQIHAERLSHVLETCNMTKHIIVGDGNCCFTAVAFSLINNTPILQDHHKYYLQSIGLDLLADMESVALQLRQLTVKEWLDHSSRYEGFLVDIAIEDEAPKFLVPGYFHGDLADTMLTALSNALQTPIIVFSSIACHPYFCLTPRTQTIPVPLMLAFNQSGAGHYDGVVAKLTTIPSATDPVRCGCGKNDTSGQTHCHEQGSKYTTNIRCVCVKAGVGCSERCRCKNCTNPCGQHQLSGIPRRKRAKHQWQKVVI